jgi:mannan endo-1,4-beta-mannosidase
MKTNRSTKLVLLVFILMSFAWFSSAMASGLRIDQGKLVESDGTSFVMRGINVAHAWFPKQTHASLNTISTMGFNCVRIVCSSGHRWRETTRKELQEILSLCHQLELMCIFEVHDTTGHGEPTEEGSVTLTEVLPFWKKHADLFRSTEDWVVINIGNEPFGNKIQPSPWFDEHAASITAMRTFGYENVLMLDADNYGQDWKRSTRDKALKLFQMDSKLIFSVHMYEVYGSSRRIETYLKSYKKHNLPLIIGEFADSHYGKPVAYESIMAIAHREGIGYLGWSWHGNNKALRGLDVAMGFGSKTLSPWGEKLVHGKHGIKSTSKKLKYFSKLQP